MSSAREQTTPRSRELASLLSLLRVLEHVKGDESNTHKVLFGDVITETIEALEALMLAMARFSDTGLSGVERMNALLVNSHATLDNLLTSENANKLCLIYKQRMGAEPTAGLAVLTAFARAENISKKLSVIRLLTKEVEQYLTEGRPLAEVDNTQLLATLHRATQWRSPAAAQAASSSEESRDRQMLPRVLSVKILSREESDALMSNETQFRVTRRMVAEEKLPEVEYVWSNGMGFTKPFKDAEDRLRYCLELIINDRVRRRILKTSREACREACRLELHPTVQKEIFPKLGDNPEEKYRLNAIPIIGRLIYENKISGNLEVLESTYRNARQAIQADFAQEQAQSASMRNAAAAAAASSSAGSETADVDEAADEMTISPRSRK